MQTEVNWTAIEAKLAAMTPEDRASWIADSQAFMAEQDQRRAQQAAAAAERERELQAERERRDGELKRQASHYKQMMDQSVSAMSESARSEWLRERGN
jgi:hypothetical protein